MILNEGSVQSQVYLVNSPTRLVDSVWGPSRWTRIFFVGIQTREG